MACADNYLIEFPKGCTWREKMLFTYALELMEMGYFEKPTALHNCNNRNNQN